MVLEFMTFVGRSAPVIFKDCIIFVGHAHKSCSLWLWLQKGGDPKTNQYVDDVLEQLENPA